ncbi:hypothetical protein ANCCAN_11248, partial [Ancylostoma caninum]
MIFLGMVGFFRKFIPNFANTAEPLTWLTRKDNKFKWTEAQEAAFIELRDALLQKPILGYPDYDKPFHIFTDASTVAQAGALMQEYELNTKKFYAVAYCSRTLSDSERRWPAVQIEMGAIIYALRPASTLPTIPEEEQILAELPAAEMVGYDHPNPTAAEAQDKPEAEVVPTHRYNLLSKKSAATCVEQPDVQMEDDPLPKQKDDPIPSEQPSPPAPSENPSTSAQSQ